MIEIVSATRLSEPEFWEESALGRSLLRLKGDSRIAARIAWSNRRGLPEIYNSRIVAGEPAEALIFVHDDVWIDDLFIVDHVVAGLSQFDIIGVAGNRRRIVNQPAWAFVDTAFTWDKKENLSGAIGHGPGPFGEVSHYGPVPAACELLDGVLLAANKRRLQESGTLFDPRFAFHFYDMDFSRTARQSGLRLGTWPVSVTHQSQGAFGPAPWREAYKRYLDKWGA